MTPLISAMPSNETMAEKLASALGAERETATVRRSPDGESYVRVESAVEGRWVAIVCTLNQPDDKLIPLLLLTMAVRGGDVTDVSLVVPYLAYMRQDNCFQPGETVNAQRFAAWLSRGSDWLTTVDPHLHCITKLSRVYVVPARHVRAAPAVATWLCAHVTRSTLVGPDEESNQWMADTVNRAGTPVVVLRKVHKGDRDVEVSVPDVERWRDHTPVLVNDIISTGHTMAETIGHLQRAGLAAPVCIAIHAVLSDDAVQDLESTGAGLVVSCDTVVRLTNGVSTAPSLASVARGLMQDPGDAT